MSRDNISIRYRGGGAEQETIPHVLSEEKLKFQDSCFEQKTVRNLRRKKYGPF